MDKALAQQQIITATLPHIAFDGWSMRALTQGAIDAGYQKTDLFRVFPGGVMDAVNGYMALADAKMQTRLGGYMLESMKIRERITLAVKLRLEAHEGEKEALRRALLLYMLPMNMADNVRTLYATVDAIWYGIGDASTDFNFYTKRATLAAVYAATLLYWLNDESLGSEATWAFLDRRIANVMQIEKAKYNARQWLKGLPLAKKWR